MNEAHNIDCMIPLWELPENSFDLAVVDPPYGLNIRGDMGRRKGKPRKYKRVLWDATPPPPEYFRDILKRQAVVNPNLVFVLRLQNGRSFEEEEFCYQNGIADYVKELAGEARRWR